MEDEAATSSLPPGFRFHPTDEEIVSYYLKRKVCGKPFRFDAVSEVDLHKCEPWDLPGKSRLKSRDLEWYFFVVLDKKYGNGGTRTNRATDQGYWKTTGKDRPVRRNNRIVGMKKTLVFHIGRAPRGERTNWVTHEYRLVDEELEKAGIVQDAYVMCRIFQKSGSGPRNGEQYGAPFIDEEWDESVMVPKCEDDAIFYVGNEGNVQRNNLEQNIDKGIPSEIVPVQFPLNFDRGDSFNHSNESRGFLNDGQKLFIGVGEKSDLPEPFDSQKFLDLPEQYQMDPPPVKDGCFVELDDLATPVVGNYHAANPVDEDLKYFDASHSLLADDGSFVEINDLQNPVEADPSGFEMLDEYLSYFDAVDNNLQYALPDSSKILDIENPILDQPAFTQEVRSGIGETFLAGPQPLKAQGGVGASSSQQESNSTKLASEVQYNEGADNTLVKRLSRMLGSIPAPPAFAEEFPAKEAAFGQNPAMHSLGSIQVTTGMIHVSGMTLRSSRKDGSLGKREDVGVHLSYDMTRVDMMAAEQLIGNAVGFEPVANILSGKAGSVTVRFGFYQIFFWVLILSVSFKIGSYIYTS